MFVQKCEFILKKINDMCTIFRLQELKKVPWSLRDFSWSFSSGRRESEPQSIEEREKTLWLPWPWISLSYRWQGQDLTLEHWLVDIFTKTQIKLIGLFNCNYQGGEDISPLISFGKFCLSLPGKKVVCKISKNLYNRQFIQYVSIPVE